ncbi:MAG: PsiF family protein [Limnohabitans sp.]
MQHPLSTPLWVRFALASALVALGTCAMAADTPAKANTPAQNRTAQCKQEAKGQTGDERKAFMQACLGQKKQVGMDTPTGSQQSKMKTCNDQARGKKGEERKAFMVDCLKA